jgi:hypothetical protein
MLIFVISDVETSQLDNMKIYFDDGFPANHTVLTDGSSFDFSDLVLEPEVVSISPNKGSIGGTLVEVTVPGVGTLQDSFSTVEIVDESGESVCDEVYIATYGKIHCITKPVEITSELFVKIDGETFAWRDREVLDVEPVCPEVPEIYTKEYWVSYYETTWGISPEAYEVYGS